MQIKARRCFVPVSPSDWVAKVFLTCDNTIAVQFNHGEKVKKVLPHGPGAYLGHGGVPSVCCLYPGTQGELAEKLYELAEVSSYAGEWVHRFLYKKFGYRLVAPPAMCGNCNTSCSLQSSLNPANVGDAVAITATLTNTDGSTTAGAAPEGLVDWYVDGTWVANSPLPPNEPPTRNWQQVGLNWTCATAGDHTIEAVYQPSAEDWTATQCSLTQSCQGGVSTSCCPGVSLPTTLYVTISNVSGCACLSGTYALSYNSEDETWMISGLNVCGKSSVEWEIFCSGNDWFLYGGGFGAVALTQVSCDPLQLTASGVTVDSAYCNGSINVTVTQ
jgi:hypothetical protein